TSAGTSTRRLRAPSCKLEPINCISDFSPVESTSTEACAVSRRCPAEVRARAFRAASDLVDHLLGGSRICQRDLVERQPEISAGKRERVKTSFSATPRHAECVIGSFVWPTADGLSGVRNHRFADRRRPVKMIAATRLAGKGQQRVREKCSERKRNVGISLKWGGDLCRPFRRRACNMQSMTS